MGAPRARARARATDEPMNRLTNSATLAARLSRDVARSESRGGFEARDQLVVPLQNKKIHTDMTCQGESRPLVASNSVPFTARICAHL